MKHLNSAFLATVASLALASAASAQTVAPGPNDGDNALHGAGATSVTNVVNDEINWQTTNEPNFAAKYVGTGSGFGKQAWRNISDQFALAGITNPFGVWKTVQYAFSDSSINTSDIATYTTNVKPYGGAAIMVPKFVLPVALAYNPVYAKDGTTEYRFNVQFPQSLPDAVTGTSKVVGGLRLNRDAYCGIFNGTIVNWNNAALTTLNNNVSLKDPTDPNWGTVGVPIRLVGRLDKSGTTDIFTRALAAQCPASGNRFANNAEALPFNPSATAPDFTPVRSDTPYKPSGTGYAGSTNSVGNQYFNRTTGTIQSVVGGLASQPTTIGNGTGLFLLADGSGGVSQAITADADIGAGTYKVNGKIGYIGSDFIANAKNGSPKLFAAALSLPGTSTTFRLPSAANGRNALNPTNPPQSSSVGAFQLTDTRLVRDPAGGANIQARRNNPLAWYDVLYPTPTTGLANPTTGYAITGTTQVLLNTCYKPTNKPHVVRWIGYNMSTPTDVFTNVTTGILAKSNIGSLPADWQRAITQTFLVNSTEASGGTTLGTLDLWIEDAATTGADHCNVGTLAGSTQPGM